MHAPAPAGARAGLDLVRHFIHRWPKEVVLVLLPGLVSSVVVRRLKPGGNFVFVGRFFFSVGTPYQHRRGSG